MDKVIQIKNFQFQNYKIGRKHLLRSLENANIDESERAAFALRHIGEFLRLARLRTGFSLEDAAKHFKLTAQELVSIEQGIGDLPASLVFSLCTKYGVEKDFEEFYAYVRAASRPQEKDTLISVRSALERLGWIRPKDW